MKVDFVLYNLTPCIIIIICFKLTERDVQYVLPNEKFVGMVMRVDCVSRTAGRTTLLVSECSMNGR